MKSILSLLLVLCVYPPAVLADGDLPSFEEKMATPVHLKRLQTGGYVIYIRHGNTDNARADRVPSVDLEDCATQRVLNKEGLQLMKRVGQNIRSAHIPVGETLTSPLCRTKDSAQALFNASYTVDHLLMYTANMTTEEKMPVIENTRRLVSSPVSDGKNRVLVAHGPNLMDMMGYFPKEGTLVIFKPLGDNQYEYLGSIPPQYWKKLLP
jgi:phosphohistidine phosphatase SixA